ncbi:MAG: hypothetical protein NXI10_16860 [bacterium]|nr:hypothetical protein [bacterium]
MEAINPSQQHPKRPVFLLVLCILSFLWLGLGFTSVAVGYAVGPSSSEQIQKDTKELDSEMEKLEAQGASTWRPTMEKLKTMTVVMNRKFYYVQALNLFIYILGTVSVVYMFIGKKLGFHLYIVYSLIYVCDYYFFMSPAAVPTFIIIVSALVAALFIFLYSRNLKWMR